MRLKLLLLLLFASGAFAADFGDIPANLTLPAGQSVRRNAANTLFEAYTPGTGGSGTPGGLDTQVQFNDVGAFGGDSAFIWNKTLDLLTITTADSANNFITDSLQLRHNSSGTPAAGYGTGISLWGQSNTTVNRVMGRIAALWQTATDGSRVSALGFYAADSSGLTINPVYIWPGGGLSTINFADPGAGVIRANGGFRTNSAGTSGFFLQGNGSVFEISGYSLPTTIGTNGYVLTVVGGNAVWAADAGGGGAVSSVTGTAPITVSPTTGATVVSTSMATDSILGRATTGTGVAEVLGSLPFAFTGDVTRAADSNALAYANAVPTTLAGLPTGGTAGQALTKINSTNYNTQWTTLGGGSGTVTSITAVAPIVLTPSPITASGSVGITVGSTGGVQAWDTDLDTWATKTPYAGTLTITTGKTFNVTNTLTLSGTDGSTLNIGTGGTLGTAAYTASTAYQAADADLTTWAGITPASGVGTYLTTPSSANLRAMVTDENGTGALLFNGATTPDFTTGFTIGGAAAARKIMVGNGTNFVPSTETWAVPGASTNNVLKSDGTNWTASQLGFSNLSGNWTLAQGPSTTASKLLGRTDASAGIPQEITLGTNLTMSGTTLNAAGGGGSVPTGGPGFYHVTTPGTLDAAVVGETGTGAVVRTNSPTITDGLFQQLNNTGKTAVYSTRYTDTAPAGNFFLGQNALATANIFYVTTKGEIATFIDANGLNGLLMQRKTNTTPSGTFLHFQDATASSTLFEVNINGRMSAGVVPEARIEYTSRRIVTAQWHDLSGSALTTGAAKGVFTATFSGTITGWTVSADTGTPTVKWWKGSSATAIPTVANVINTSTGFNLASGTHIQSTNFTGANAVNTTTVNDGDMFIAELTGVTGSPTWVDATLEVTVQQ